MKVPIKVLYQDGAEKRLIATARDAVEFERRYRMSFARIWGVPEIKAADGSVAAPAEPPQEEWWYFLAWSRLSRTGEDTRDFENFVNAIEGVTFDDTDETADVEGPDV